MDFLETIRNINMRLDSWKNLVTGLGDITRDKTLSHIPVAREQLSYEQLSTLYDDDDLASLIVDLVVDDALRKGYQITCDPSVQHETRMDWTDRIVSRLKELRFDIRLDEACRWGRVFGLGVIYIAADDSQTQDAVLKPESVKKIYNITALDPRDIRVDSFNKDTRSPDLREPEFYRLTMVDATSGSINELIHSSRVLAFPGQITSYRKKLSSGRNHDLSVLHRCYESIRDFDSSYRSAASMLSDSSFAVIKMNGFFQALASKMREVMETRIEIMEMSKYVGRLLPIDIKEELEYVERTFTSIPELLDRFQARLAASSRYPITRLFGRSPAGENATGESDLILYYDQVSAYQARITPMIERMVRLVAYELKAPSPELWGIEWVSLWQMSPEEEANYRDKIADTDKKYIDMGALTPSVVAAERFTGDKYSPMMPRISEEEIEPGQREPEPQDQTGQMSQAMEAVEERRLVNDIDLKIIEQLVKSGAGNRIVAAFTERLARREGVATEAIIDEIRSTNYKWYTATVAEINTTGETEVELEDKQGDDSDDEDIDQTEPIE
jgi:uncharacterized protein